MAKRWQELLIQKAGLAMENSARKYPFKEPFLSKPADDDLSKQWVVEYSAWSEQREKLVRKRVVIKGETVEARMADARSVIDTLTRELKRGAYIEPLAAPPPVAKVQTDLSPDVAISKAVDYYLEVVNSSLKKSSRRTYSTCANTFKRFLAAKKLGQTKIKLFGVAQAYQFTDYLAKDCKMANRNFNKHRGFMVTFFEFFRKRRIIAVNPISEAEIGKKKVKSGQHIPFNLEQIEQVVQYLRENPDPQFWLFISCIYYLFARPHEELRLVKIRHLFENTLLINPDDAKDRENNHKIIPPPLAALLTSLNVRNYPAHYYLFSKSGTPGPEPVGESYFYERHRKMLKFLNFPVGYDLYGWKHTGVIALYLETKDMKLIQQQCGHSTITQTDEYLRDLGLFLDYKRLDKFPPLGTITGL